MCVRSSRYLQSKGDEQGKLKRNMGNGAEKERGLEYEAKSGESKAKR